MADETGMEIDSGPSAQALTVATADSTKEKPRFEIKKYNAVALWAWGK